MDMTGLKFGRTYKISFKVYKRVKGVGSIPDPQYLNKEWILEQTPDQQGLFIEWDITRDNSAKINSAVIKITNLPLEFREMLRKDNLSGGGWKGLDDKVVLVQFSFGYGTYLSTLCYMELLEGTSEKSGTEWVTTLHLTDGAVDLNDTVLDEDYIIPQGKITLTSTIIKDLISRFTFIEVGLIMDERLDWNLDNMRGDYKFFKGQTVWACIRQLLPTQIGGFDVNMFIDNGKLHIVWDNVVLDNLSYDVISEETGLLSVPMVRETQIEIITLCEPRLNVGQGVRVEYKSPLIDMTKTHKVFSIKHKGDSMTGECTSRLLVQMRDDDFIKKVSI